MIVTTHEFDGDLLIIEHISALEENPKGAFADFLADAIVHANHIGRGVGRHFVGESNYSRAK